MPSFGNDKMTKQLKMSIESNSLLKKGHATGTTRSVRSIALTEKELEIVRAEMAKSDFKLTGK